jgi:hypothetical protein
MAEVPVPPFQCCFHVSPPAMRLSAPGVRRMVIRAGPRQDSPQRTRRGGKSASAPRRERTGTAVQGIHRNAMPLHDLRHDLTAG